MSGGPADLVSGGRSPVTVGLIANPASGKDVRRLVAWGTVVGTPEKIQMIRRLLLALDAGGVERVAYLKDPEHLVERAARKLPLSLQLQPVDVEPEGREEDTVRAARWMRVHGVAAAAVLGGDGTCRAFFEGAGDLPFLGLSTGTNNAFPRAMEAAVAGTALAWVAVGYPKLDPDAVPNPFRSLPALLVELPERDTQLPVLVDLATTRMRFTGSRAVWEAESLVEVVVPRARPASTGLGAAAALLDPAWQGGLYVRFGRGGRRLRVPLAPGIFPEVGVLNWRRLADEEALELEAAATLAVDGERSHVMHGPVHVRRLPRAVRVIDVEAALRGAAEAGWFWRG